MPDQSRLQRLSETLYWTTLALSVVLPLIVLYYAGKGVADPGSLLTQAPVLPADLIVTRAQAGLVAAVAIASLLPMLAALRAMTRLFDRYRMGEVLSHANATTILTIGRALLAVAAFTIAVPTLHALILSWNAPQRVLSIALDSGTLGFAIAAGLLTVIGWAMAEAARIKAENEGFV
jgi:mannose/fructose/N-acetylgalactosamine-specific phosphotransferase system component IIC